MSSGEVGGRWMRRGLYIGVCTLVVASLASELGLVLRRRSRLGRARAFAAANPFEAARDVREAGGRSLWLVPGKRYRPGARLDLDVAGRHYSIVINSLGYRTREFASRKPAGTFRVACIGGSTTVQGPTNEETYPALLERKLRARRRGVPVEVLNLGLSGSDSKLWMSRLGEVLALQPDVIVQYEFVNDLFWVALPDYASRHPWSTAGRRWSLLLGRLFPPPPLDFGPAYETMLRRALRMKRTAAQEGADYLFASFAGPDLRRASPGFAAYLDFNTESWGGRYGLRRYADYRRVLDAYNQRQQVFAEENGIASAPADAIRDPDLFVDLCHMTPKGIDALAEVFVPLVLNALDARQSAAPGRRP